MKPRFALFTTLALLLFAGVSPAVEPSEMLANPALEARARAIGKELRCLVCQNESIDESNAPLAHDLRVLVRQRLVKGDSDTQVEQFVVARYGDYVLLRPPFKTRTYLLWFGPLILLVCAAGTAVFFYRRSAPSAPLTDEERSRLAALLAETGRDEERR